MKVKLITERDDYIEIEVIGEDTSLFDALGEFAQGMEGVQYASYRLDHQLTGKVFFMLKTEPSKVKARDALLSSLSNLKDYINSLKGNIEKIL